LVLFFEEEAGCCHQGCSKQVSAASTVPQYSYSKPPMIVMLCFYFENSAMKSVTKTAEGKPPQHGPQWIEAKVHVYLNSKCHMDVISVCVD